MLNHSHEARFAEDRKVEASRMSPQNTLTHQPTLISLELLPILILLREAGGL